jgi:hypothetical protein
MKSIKSKITACLFFNIFLINHSGFSQHLLYNDLLSLYNNNTEENEGLLNKKGFSFQNSKKDREAETTLITWIFSKQGVDNGFSNEFFTKECTSVFMNNCEKIAYYLTDEKHFDKLKSSMKLNFYKFLFSDTNDNGVLSHYYLIAGPIQVRFCTIPKSEQLTTKIYVIELKKVEITVENK